MQTATATEPKTPRRQSPRKKSKPETATKQKLTLYVTADGASVLASTRRCSRPIARLVEQLIADHLKRSSFPTGKSLSVPTRRSLMVR